MPSEKASKELELRAGYDRYGLGLVMSANNTVMQVEPGGVVLGLGLGLGSARAWA